MTDCTNAVYLRLRQIYCCAGAEFCRPNLQEAWEEIAALEIQRDEFKKNYQFMVDNAAKEKLDGYRELGERAAKAESEVDALRLEIAATVEEQTDLIYHLVEALCAASICPGGEPCRSRVAGAKPMACACLACWTRDCKEGFDKLNQRRRNREIMESVLQIRRRI